MASWHLVVPGVVRSAGAAFEPLMRLLPGGCPWGAARRAGGTPSAPTGLVDRSPPRWVAAHRTRWAIAVTGIGARRRGPTRRLRSGG